MSYQRDSAARATLSGTRPHPLVKDMTDMRFGRLVVLAWAGTAPNRQAIWQCQCDCGNEVIVNGSQLRAGKTTSCGCVKREQWKKTMSATEGEAFRFAQSGKHPLKPSMSTWVTRQVTGTRLIALTMTATMSRAMSGGQPRVNRLETADLGARSE